ncbi:MAG TPA: hypothetical protein VM100_00075, partial [Longimicrobiales bacterium]|nr:hypothetical protein [Longimicrobiales bacterium]
MRTRSTLLAIAFALSGARAHAQTSQFSAQLFVRAAPSPFFADWERNPQFATLTVSYTGTSGTEYTLQAEVRGAKRGVISRSTSGPYRIVLGPSTQIISSSQLACFTAENVQDFVDQIARSGIIPEDQYTLTVKVVDEANRTVATVASSFSIVLPDPPRLSFPLNNAEVTTAQPMLQWMPVQIPAEIGLTYRVMLVEILDQQSPEVAIRSNPRIFETSITGTTHLLYPIDALPLDEDKRYAWQVEALDRDGNPITSARRRSEVWSFKRTASMTELIASIPDTAVLVPGFARLTGLKRAVIQGRGADLRLNGDATLELTGITNANTRVQLSNLQIDARDPAPIGGRFSGTISVPLRGNSGVELRSVTWDVANGLRMGARVLVPGHDAVDLDGEVEVTPGGLHGVLFSRKDFAGWDIGNATTSIKITGVRVALPEASVTLTANVTIFGQQVCSDVPLSGGSLELSCVADTNIALVANGPSLRVRRVDGSIKIAGPNITSSLTVGGDLRILGDCSVAVELNVEATSARSTRAESSCNNATARMGTTDMVLSNLSLASLTYGSSGFQFAATLDAQPRVPNAPFLHLPAYLGVTVTQAGIQFPAVSDVVSGNVRVGGFEVQMQSIRTDGFTLAWNAPNMPRVAVAGAVVFADLDNNAPLCLSAVFPARIEFDGGAITATLAEKRLAQDCTRTIGNDGAVNLRHLSGRVSAALTQLSAPREQPTVLADLVLPSYFTCSSRLVTLGDAPLSIDGRGVVRGRVGDVSTSCTISLAAVSLGLSSAAVQLAGDSATLSGEATGTFAANDQAIRGSGNVAIDLVGARMTSGRVTFNGPFKLSLPRANPTLTFTVPQAVLDTSGLSIDGRGALQFSDSGSVAVTFNRLLINPLDFTIASGTAHFDNAFGLAATITESALAWRAVPSASDVAGPAALRIDIPASATLGNTGLVAAGASTAAIYYKGYVLKSGTSDFSDDFALKVAPFEVGGGSVDISEGVQHVATIDAAGFHASDGLKNGGVPARVGLPSAAVAYLDLSNTSLFDVQRRADGFLRIRNKPGQQLPLTIPALANTSVSVNVDIVANSSGTVVSEGRIEANIPVVDMRAMKIPALATGIFFDAANPTVLGVRAMPLIFGGNAQAVRFEFDGEGKLSADATATFSGTTTLLASSDSRTTVAIVSDSAHINVDGDHYAYDVHGRVRLNSDGNTIYSAPATITIDAFGATVTEIEEHGTSSGSRRIGSVDATITALRFDNLGYVDRGSHVTWSPALDVDAKFGFAAIPGLDLPAVQNLRLTNRGLEVPAFTIPELSAAAIKSGGFDVRPLALRMTPAVLDWFNGKPSTAWAPVFDAELIIPASFGKLAGTHLTFLNARLVNGQFVGAAEPLLLSEPANIALGDAGNSVRITGLNATLGENSYVAVRGTIVPGRSLSCTRPDLTPDVVRISSQGDISGSSALTCTAQWSSLRIASTSAKVTLSGSLNAPLAVLAGEARGELPSNTNGTGRMTLDLNTMKLTGDNVVIFDGPFILFGPNLAQDLRFVGNSATVGSAGLVISGAGAAELRDGAAISPVRYNAATIELASFKLVAGSIAFTQPVTLGAMIGNGGSLSWRVRVPNGWEAAGDQLNTTLSLASFDVNGLHAANTGTGRIAFRARDGSTDIALKDDVRFNLVPTQLASGTIEFNMASALAGQADRRGFTAGPVFDAAPLPEYLGLPTSSLGSIRLRDGGNNLLVDMLPIGDEVTISGKGGALVPVTMPSWKSAIPLQGRVELVLDAKTFMIKRGTIEIESNFNSADDKLSIRRIVFSDEGSGFKWKAMARPLMPASLTAVSVEFALGVTENGLDGSVVLPVRTTVTSGALLVDVDSVAAKYVANSGDVRIVGNMRTPLFDRTPIHYSGSIISRAAKLIPDATSLPRSLPVRSATFEPMSIKSAPGLTAIADDKGITLTANGVLRMPKLAQDFALTLTDLKAGKDGVSIGGTVGQTQAFRLFGASWTIKTAPSENMATFVNDILALNLNGDVEIFGKTAKFRDFNINVDGAVTDRTNLLRDTFAVNNFLRVTKLATKGGRMDARLVVGALPGGLDLPAEDFDSLTLTIGVDGGMSNNSFALRNEAPGMRPSAHMKKSLQLTLHPRAVRLAMPSLDGKGIELQVVADAYLQSDAYNHVSIGTDVGGKFLPGMVADEHGVTWQNFSLRDTIIVDVKKMLEVYVYGATVPRADTFEIGLAGRLAIALPMGGAKKSADSKAEKDIGVGLSFRDLYLQPARLDFTAAQVDGGVLSLGPVLIDVSRFRVSETPTTIKIASSQRPPGSPPGPADSTSISVSSYIDIGGNVCISPNYTKSVRQQVEKNCMFAGGVDRVLAYTEETSRHFNLIINRANISIQEQVAITIDFRYQEVDGGVSLAFAGTGSLLKFDGAPRIVLAGMVEIGAETRVGAFLAVERKSNALGPAIQLTGIGGGFLWNPRQEWIDMIRRAALADGMKGSNVVLATEPARFAIFLYAQVSIMGDKAGKGRALVTVTDRQYRLDANLALMDKPEKMFGNASIVIGLQRPYIEGTIDVTVIEPGIMRAKGNVAFFANSKEWGVFGHGAVSVFPAENTGGGNAFTKKLSIGIKMETDFFFGPAGFVTTFSYSQSFSLMKLVSANAGLNGMVWFYGKKSEWGGYGAVEVSASVLGGLASATGRIEGAVVLPAKALPSLYLGGTLSVSVLFVGAWSGSVWAQIAADGVDGGFGSNDAMERALANAQKIRSDLEESKKQVSAAMAEASNAALDIKLTQQDLLTAYAGLQQLAAAKTMGQMQALVFTEKFTLVTPDGMNGDDVRGLYDSYVNMLAGEGMPKADTAQITALGATAQKKWDETRQLRSKADATVRSLTITAQTAKATSFPTIGGNPAKIVFPIASVSAPGDSTDKACSGCAKFELDEAAAEAQKAASLAVQSATANVTAEMLKQAKALDESIAKVQTAMSGGDGSLQSVLSSFSDARNATAAVYGLQLDYLGGALNWTQGRLATWRANQNKYFAVLTSTQTLFKASQALVSPNSKSSGPGIFFTSMIVNLLRQRSKTLSTALNQPSLAVDFEKALPSGWSLFAPLDTAKAKAVSDAIYSTGKILYVDIPLAGLQDAATEYQKKVSATADTLRMRMAPIESAHLALSSAIDGIYNTEERLAGVAYDLYDAYLQIAPASAEKDAAKLRMEQLKKGLTPPNIPAVNVAVRARGATAQVDASWPASHDVGVTEYLFRDDAGAGKIADALYSNAGKSTVSVARSLYEESDATKTSPTRSFTAAARGGYGVLATLSTNYTINYARAATSDTTRTAIVSTAANDKSAPAAPVVMMEGTNGLNQFHYTWRGTKLLAKWSAVDRESGISSYSVAIGSDLGLTDVKPWQVVNGRTDMVIDM